MKKSFFSKALVLLLVISMLCGQLMTGYALAAGDAEIPTLFEEDDTGDGGEFAEDPDEDPEEPAWEPVEPTEPAAEVTFSGTEEDSAIEDGRGGITVSISTAQSTEVRDGDTFTFTVYVDDENLTLLPNIVDGSELIIQLPAFLKRDSWESMLHETSYFKDYRFDAATNTLTLVFKEPDGTYVYFGFNISTTVDTIGIEGEPAGDIKVGIRGVLDDSPLDTIHVGVGTGSGEDLPQEDPYLRKHIWSNVKASQYGINDYQVVRDETKPIGYSLAVGINDNYSGSVSILDNLSAGDLAVCDAQGNTGSAAELVQVIIDGETWPNGSTHPKLGTLTITDDAESGFYVCFSRDEIPEGAEGRLVNVEIRYFGILTGSSNNISNSAGLVINGQYRDGASSAIVRREDQGLFVSKSIVYGGNAVKVINLGDEDAAVTFRINLSQVGLSSSIRDGKLFVFDMMEDCFVFDPDAVSSNCDHFRLEADGQKINVVKNGDGVIPQGNYHIDFTVGIDLDRLPYGAQATNVVGNEVYIRRPAKLTVNKYWTGSADIGKGARFELYYGTRLVSAAPMSAGSEYTLLFWADDLNEGVNTYTLRETVDPDSGYVAHRDIPVVIEKTGDNTVTIVSAGDREYHSGAAAVDVHNEPDGGVGTLTFRKYGEREKNENLIDGGVYELYRVDGGGDELIDTFRTIGGVKVLEELPYGEYYVKEISAPAGYLIMGSGTSAHVTIKKIAPHGSVKLLNNRYREGAVEILKSDENGTPLAGVSFTLTAQSGAAQTKTTDENGRLCFSGLEAGSYTVAETVPEGYTGYEGHFHLTIDEKGGAHTAAVPRDAAVAVSGSVITINWTNVRLFGGINITKYGESLDERLAGAEFALYDSGNAEVRRGVTGDDGALSFTGLAYGKYILRELTAPDGFVVSDELSEGVSVTVGSTVPVSLSFKNSEERGSIRIIKKDSATGRTLAGARFGLYSDPGSDVPDRIAATDGSGACSFTGLRSGVYYVREIAAPAGYILSDETRSFTVGVAEGAEEYVWTHESVFTNDKKLYNISFIKTNESGAKRLPGAEFTLTGGGLTLTALSDERGAVTFEDIPFGTYTVTETKAPAGYVGAKSFTVTVGEGNTPAAYSPGQTVDAGTVKNEHTRLTVLKVDGKNSAKGLPGTKFVIMCGESFVTAEGADGAYVYTGLAGSGTEFVTGGDGTFVLEYIPSGSYILRETQAPAGYIISSEDKAFEITDAAESVTVGNTEIRGGVTITKTDGRGRLLAGVGFTVRTAEGYVRADGGNGVYSFAGIGETPDVLYTAEDGTLSLGMLPWGTYTADEDAATTPAGLVPETGISFEITAAQHEKTLALSVVNRLETEDIVLLKLDAAGKGLSGAVFRAVCISSTAYSDSEVRYAVSDENGEVRFKGLPAGIYEVSEYVAPAGKRLNTEVYILRAGGTELPEGVELSELPVVCVNEDITHKTTVRKVSADGTPVTGMVFDITDTDGNVIYADAAVNSADGAELELPAGEYYLVEKKAPENYIKLEEPQHFTVTEGGRNEIVVKNEPVRGSLTVIKTDGAGSRLSGAEFAVYDTAEYYADAASAVPLYTMITDSTGTASVGDIPFGSYTAAETRAPAGYELCTAAKSFTISAENGSAGVELTFVNEKSRYVFELFKADINDEERLLPGTEFLVYGEGFHRSVVTGADGGAVVEVPAPGRYSIIETKAPEGYTLDPNVHHVEVEEHTPEGADIAVRFVSRDYPTRLRLLKTDENGDTLPDAEFELYSAGGAESLVSLAAAEGGYVYAPGGGVTRISAGDVLISGLPCGRYVLREVTPPAGYMAIGDIHFELDGSAYDKPVTLTVPNLPHERGVAVCKENTDGVRLPGAEFTLYDAEGTAIAAKTTGAGGYVRFTELRSGSYIIKETAAPAGYIADGHEFGFTIGDDGTVSGAGFEPSGDGEQPFYVLTVVNESVKFGFEIVKLSSLSGKRLDGAQFRLLGRGVNRVFTTVDGAVYVDGLNVGEYMLSEIKAPDGYDISFESAFVQVTPDGVYIDGEMLTGEKPRYTVKDDPGSFRLSVVKLDETTSAPLEGAAFTVTSEGGEKYYLVTDGHGMTDTVTLLPGKYAVTETAAPKGYNVPLAGWGFTVEEGSMRVVSAAGGAEHSFENGVLTLTITNRRTTGSILICKSDSADRDLPLAGAKFMLLDGSGENVWFTVKNGVYQAAAASDEGAGNVVTTDATGRALIGGVPFGSYTVREVEAPTGYAVRTQSAGIKLTEQDETLTVNVENDRLTRRVTVIKESAGDKPERLFGAVFTLYSVSDGRPGAAIAESTTLYDGAAYFNVPFGDYLIVETRAPQGYELSLDEPVFFSYNADTPEDEPFVFTFTNEKTRYAVRVLKTDENSGEPLAGAVFALTDSRGYIRLAETGGDGAALFDDVAYDDYTLRELTAPEGYYLSGEVIEIPAGELVHGREITVAVKDKLILGSVRLRKVDLDDETKVLDASFEVRDADGRLLLWTETEDGYELADAGESVIRALDVTLSGIPAGDYVINELTAPDGYLKLDDGYGFTVDEKSAQTPIDITVRNPIRTVALGIIKHDSKDRTKRLKDAEFTLFRADDGKEGEVFAAAVTDANGNAVFTGLTMGEYILRETKAPYGYKLWEKTLGVSVDKDGGVTVGGRALPDVDSVFMAAIANERLLRDFTVVKTDLDSKKPLSGAVFELRGPDGTQRLSSDESGLIKLRLPYGEYELEEIAAPEGYMLSGEKYTLTVSENGVSVNGAAAGSARLSVTNAAVKYPFAIHKQDAAHAAPLSGAEFTVKGEYTEEKLACGADGNSDTVYLRPGEYAVSETKAPAGYKLPLSGWTLTVGIDGSMTIDGEGAALSQFGNCYVAAIENTAPGGSSTLTKTGESGRGGLLLAGSALMLGSFTGLLLIAVGDVKRRRAAGR